MTTMTAISAHAGILARAALPVPGPAARGATMLVRKAGANNLVDKQALGSPNRQKRGSQCLARYSAPQAGWDGPTASFPSWPAQAGHPRLAV